MLVMMCISSLLILHLSELEERTEWIMVAAGMQKSPGRQGDTSRMTLASILTRRTWAHLVSARTSRSHSFVFPLQQQHPNLYATKVQLHPAFAFVPVS